MKVMGMMNSQIPCSCLMTSAISLFSLFPSFWCQSHIHLWRCRPLRLPSTSPSLSKSSAWCFRRSVASSYTESSSSFCLAATSSGRTRRARTSCPSCLRRISRLNGTSCWLGSVGSKGAPEMGSSWNFMFWQGLLTKNGYAYLWAQDGSSFRNVLQRIWEERISQSLCPAEFVDDRNKVHLDGGFGENFDDIYGLLIRRDRSRGDHLGDGDPTIDNPPEQRGGLTHAYCRGVRRVGVESERVSTLDERRVVFSLPKPSCKHEGISCRVWSGRPCSCLHGVEEDRRLLQPAKPVT